MNKAKIVLLTISSMLLAGAFYQGFTFSPTYKPSTIFTATEATVALKIPGVSSASDR